MTISAGLFIIGEALAIFFIAMQVGKAGCKAAVRIVRR
jgi:hypothetical protein